METVEVKINTNVKSATNEMSLFRKEIQQLRGQLLSLEEGTEEYNNTLSELANKQFQLREMNENVRYTVTDLGEQLATVTRITSGVVAGFSAVQGAAQLFGADSENLQQTMVKLQAAMAMVQGLQGLEGLGKDLGRAAIQFKGVIPTIKTFIGGLSLMKKALLATGIGALIVAIGTLIAYGPEIAKFFKKTKSEAEIAAEELREFNQAVGEEAASAASKSIVKLTSLASSYRQLGGDIEAQKKFIKDNASELEQMGIKINDVNDADDVFINKTDDYINALIARAKAQATVNIATKEYEEYLKQRAATEKELAAAQDTLDKTPQAYVSKKGTYKDGYGVEREGTILVKDSDWQEAEDNVDRLENQLIEMERNANASLKRAFDTATQYNEEANKLLEDTTTASYKAQQKAAEDAIAQQKAAAAEQERIRKEQLAKIEKEKQEIAKINERIKISTMSDEDAELYKLTQQYEAEKTLLKQHGQDIQALTDYYEGLKSEVTIKYQREREQRVKDEFENWKSTMDEAMASIDAVSSSTKDIELEKSDNLANFDYQEAQIGFSFIDPEDIYNKQVEANNAALQADREAYEQKKLLIEEQLNDENLTAEQKMQLLAMQAQNEMDLSNAVLENDKRNAQAKKQLEKAKQAAVQGTLDVTSSVLKSAAQLAGEESKAGKALAVSAAIIDTFSAANSAYAAMAGIPFVGPALGIAAAAAAIASGVMNVKNILAVNDKGETGMAGAQSAPNVSASVLPPEVYGSQLSDLTEIDLQAQEKETKVYVLENDITETQNAVKTQVEESTF